MASSAQDIYLNSKAPAEAPRASGWEFMWNGMTGKWDERVREYNEAVNEYNAQKLLTQAQWEREDNSYQRLVADLKKAGINPYYALSQSGLSLAGNSSANDVYTTKGKSSKVDNSKGTAGLIAVASLLLHLLLA